MKLYFARHGQTNWNIQNRLQGSSDIPLNETGIQQAHTLADKLKNVEIDLIISSPLSRALDTANIVNSQKQIQLITNNSLVERNFGCLEGIKGYEYDRDLYWDYNKDYKYKDVESIQSFFTRVHTYIDNLIKQYPNKNILLVSHNGVYIATECYFNGLPANNNLLNLKLDNCSYAEYDSNKIKNNGTF